MSVEGNNRMAHGGKAIYGARLGILMLEARFPRIPGDMGNAGTWPFPVLYKVVAGASPQRVVREKAAGLLPDFIAAARELAALGADGITTNCGFLSLYQKELAAAVAVPVATSSLMQVPMIQSTLPAGKRVGVLTVNAASLTPGASDRHRRRSIRAGGGHRRRARVHARDDRQRADHGRGRRRTGHSRCRPSAGAGARGHWRAVCSSARTWCPMRARFAIGSEYPSTISTAS